MLPKGNDSLTHSLFLLVNKRESGHAEVSGTGHTEVTFMVLALQGSPERKTPRNDT